MRANTNQLESFAKSFALILAAMALHLVALGFPFVTRGSLIQYLLSSAVIWSLAFLVLFTFAALWHFLLRNHRGGEYEIGAGLVGIAVGLAYITVSWVMTADPAGYQRTPQAQSVFVWLGGLHASDLLSLLAVAMVPAVALVSVALVGRMTARYLGHRLGVHA